MFSDLVVQAIEGRSHHRIMQWTPVESHLHIKHLKHHFIACDYFKFKTFYLISRQ